MRFDKVIPKENWTAEKTNQRIETVMSDIATFNKSMNKIDSQINDLKNRKGIIKKKVAYKWKYLKQLQKQLKEM
jgi:septal ring factor EnvC (AmiA/AmiB activator)